MVPAASRKIPRVPRYSGYRSALDLYRYGGVTLYAWPFQTIPVESIRLTAVLQPRPRLDAAGLGSSAFARHYLRNHNCFLFLWVLRCFSSPRSPHLLMITSLQLAELPHSDMSGSIVVCTSPNLFAAYHVLHRLLEPRHPPFALFFFFYNVKLFSSQLTCD